MADLTPRELEIRDFIVTEVLQGSAPLAITRDLNLIETEIVDSLAIFALVEHLEQRYGFTVQPEDIVIANFESVAAICALIDLRTAPVAS